MLVELAAFWSIGLEIKKETASAVSSLCEDRFEKALEKEQEYEVNFRKLLEEAQKIRAWP